jgi:hypothetical protein
VPHLAVRCNAILQVRLNARPTREARHRYQGRAGWVNRAFRRVASGCARRAATMGALTLSKCFAKGLAPDGRAVLR